MIHPEAREKNAIATEAQVAYLTAHPHIDPNGMHNDLAAIEWRHGYITAARITPGPSAPERAEIDRFGIFDEENAS